MYLDRIPPYDISAEEATLGAVLIESVAMQRVIDIVTPNDFFLDKHRWIYESYLSMYGRNEEINLITLAHELAATGRLAEVSRPFLKDLFDKVPTSAGVEHYAKLVARLAVMRRLIDAGNRIAGIGFTATGTTQEAVDQAQEILATIHQDSQHSNRLMVTDPSIVETNQPHFECTVNGQLFRFPIKKVKSWASWVDQSLALLFMIPSQPKNWVTFINNILERARHSEAPPDASEEHQLKLTVRKWLNRQAEADNPEPDDMESGQHLLREHKGQEYYFFRASPLLKYLNERGLKMASDELWASHILVWGGTTMPLKLGKDRKSIRLWGLPIDFDKDQHEEGVPEWF